MPEQPPGAGGPDPPVVDHIEELARRLREAKHLDPAARTEVADLLRDLVEALDQPEPSPHADELAQGTAELVRAVNDRHDPGLIEAARDRLEEVVARAEAKAPVATEVVLRLIDVLAGLGI